MEIVKVTLSVLRFFLHFVVVCTIIIAIPCSTSGLGN